MTAGRVPDLRRVLEAIVDLRLGPWLLRREKRISELFPDHDRRDDVPHRRVLRADDMIVLDLALHGLVVDPAPEGERLRRDGPTAVLVVEFPPQAIAEEVFPDFSTTTDTPSPLAAGALPASTRHAGLSRLAYRMPDGVEAIDLTVVAVLRAMADWPVAVAQLATGAGGGSDLAREIALRAADVARMLPPEHRERGIEIAERAARRAATSVRIDPSAEMIREAVQSMRQEVAAAAARHIDLDTGDRAVLDFRADLALARQLVEPETAHVAATGLLDLLPGLLPLSAPRKPAKNVTAIELPYRLVQSPDGDAAWSHSPAPITRSGRTELWHTRLGQRINGRVVDATEATAALRAIWSPDYGGSGGGEPGFSTSLSAQDRHELVQLTADPTGVLPGPPRRRYHPLAARARRLMLTALGGWIDVEGTWETRPANKSGLPLSLVGWKHHAALGRDWFVETVRVGRLLPLGHRAVAVTQTERRFEDATDGSGHVAALRQRVFIEVREPLRNYPDPTQPFEGRDFPFRTVEILTKRTPSLLLPTGESFWPRVLGPAGVGDFRFEIRTTDIAGSVSRFDLPLRFVSDAVPVASAIAQYNGADQSVPVRTTTALGGQPVQLAPASARVDASGTPDPGDVVYPVRELRFGAAEPTVPAPADGHLTRFHPWLRTMQVMSTALTQLTGNAAPAEMEFAAVYRQKGFDAVANKAELLLTATGPAALQADFATRSNSDKAGGIVTPNFGVTGTSRAFGLVGGDTNLLAGGTFDPGSFFPSAKIFGGVDLKDILAPVVVALAGATVPKLRTTRTREKIETVFEHRVENVPNSVPLLRMNERGTSKLDVKALMTAYFRVEDPSVAPIGSGPGAAGGNPPGLKDPEASAEATLTWFKLNFFGCIIVSFDSFKFKVSAAKGVDADPKIAETDGVVFGGPLAFVDSLRRTLSGSKKTGGGAGGGAGGGGGGIPGFEVTPIFKPEVSGLTVGVKLGVTKLPLGIFTLKNLMVSNAIKLPFDGSPLSLQFGFAERANPFQLVVSLFGGGGFVVIGLDTKDSVKEIEAALEFGAFAELDFGVASGAIYVKAGIYIYWNKPDEQTTLKGYVEMGGEVQVIGLISVSILMHLSLGYYKVAKVSEVRGQATLVIEVEILFFSTSVNLTVERRFGGAEADPTFANLIPTASLWDSYAEAFA